MCFNTNYSYKTNGNRTSLIIDSIENNNDKYNYIYDSLGNITHIYHNDILENVYYYNEYNELIKEDNYVLNNTIRYKCDNYGNILSKKIYELNTYNQIEQNIYEYKNSLWKDQLTKFNNVEITYELEGNKIIFEKSNENVIYYIRSVDERLIRIKYNKNIYYYIKNI